MAASVDSVVTASNPWSVHTALTNCESLSLSLFSSFTTLFAAVPARRRLVRHLLRHHFKLLAGAHHFSSECHSLTLVLQWLISGASAETASSPSVHTALAKCTSRSLVVFLISVCYSASSPAPRLAPLQVPVQCTCLLRCKVAFLLYLLFLSRAFCLHEVVELRISKLEGEAGIRFLHTDICRGHKAWSGHNAPTAVDIEDVLARTQNRTTFITCTKRGAAIINDHTVQVLFRNRRQRLLAQVPGDYEDNQDNHGEGGKLCTDRAPVPAQVPLYRGLRIVLTKNLDKEHHFVNGMGAVVEAVDLETPASCSPSTSIQILKCL